MSQHHRNWPRRPTRNENAGRGQSIPRTNPPFGPGDSRSDNPASSHQSNASRANTWERGRRGSSQSSQRSRHSHPGPSPRGGRSDTQNVDIPGKQLLANHFAIELGDYRQIYSYDLKISRLVDNQSQTPGSGSADAGDQKPRKIARQKKKRLIHLLLERLKSEKSLPGPVATDYLKLFITTKQLNEDATSREINFYDEYSVDPGSGLVPGCDRYRVDFERPKVISLDNLFAHYRRSPQSQTAVAQQSNEAPTDAINALNIIFSYLPYQKCFSKDHQANLPLMTTVKGQTFYGIAQPPPSELVSTETGKMLDNSGGLYSIPGFSRSVRGSFGSSGHVDLNIYIKTGCFWQHGSAQDMIQAWITQNSQKGGPNLHALQDFLRRTPVRLTFEESGLDRFSVIKGLARVDQHPSADICQMQRFDQQHPGGSVKDYFSTNYNWQMNRDVYVVKIGKLSQKGYMTVPADRLQVLPGRIKPSEIPQRSTRYPDANYKMIVNDGRRTFYPTDRAEGGEGAAAFRLKIDSKMAAVPVTVLARPNLMYKARGNRGHDKYIDGAFINAGQWNVRDAAFVRPASGKKWSCVELTAKNQRSKCSEQGFKHFVDNLEKAFPQYGMEGFVWSPFNLQGRYTDDDLFPTSKTASSFLKRDSAIEKLLKAVKEKGVQLVVLLLPSHDLELYGSIKRAGDQSVGISTVCHVLRHDNRVKALLPKSLPLRDNGTNDDFLANLCMKINLKSGETTVNQALRDNPKILSPKTMILGIDVAHGGGPRKHCPSVAAVVGSINAEFSQWPASLLANPCSTRDDEEKEANEKILDLDVAVYQRLLDYYDRNHGKDSEGRKDNGIPEQIIVYRDGVSESQFEMCKNYEYGKIGQALSKLFQQKALPVELLPKVTLICAIKRHHTRLFPDPDGQDESILLNPNGGKSPANKNPLPGCVVMDRITYGEGNDFFLVGQKAIQGTARPVHYNVLQNPHNYDIQDIARMTYHLCYLFGRSRTSVGPCTPVYYADLVADRARCFVRQFYNPPHDDDNPVRPFDDSELPAFRRCLQLHPDIEKTMFYI
ncbi:uncharacterized protein Z520_11112 [Fonsecaea multimorphosa CBS 102226]|uniref:Piwi domain-containing protein n=1 Tax=Fonsecaea multimorphosa CBS 102226 TaxID=1442371 RepID=A0A0D2I7T5_9EURO|nr:uncharacterized protein Z520_11112 [Fonsecaea multimorphosa CBS 102226]KIX93256.1 hypothetical protein Z520_11112 [Fonsecaea multimorphosa CBS 102226]OAL18486.1 hypothetical protein AYO22_10682 [Fonsecaea multimorphosa]